ncbi:hypothetical protein EV702DRAFT_1046677 [Suillus placidus]|uniref:Uncharacterized protein n=1 Tax=Suillus placidus TaxID=48579 RepID=A0A9P7D1P5_9AGAM|nr:hypothetical protein EV702DRAFT_1046677 [Suillus placidus]
MASLPAPPPQLPLIPGTALRMTSIGLVVDCLTCGVAVPVTICQSDRNGNAGKPMARHGPCGFFKWFPELFNYPEILARIPRSFPSPQLSAVPAMPSAVPAPSQSKRPQKRGPDCVRDLCRRPSALQCPEGKCAMHCTEDGGCTIHSAPILDDVTLDAEGFGYYHLHQALSQSLVADGLEAPPPLPAHVPSIHDLLTAPAPTIPPLASTSARLPSPARPSTTPVSRMSKPPRITSQLDPLWQQDLQQRAQKELESTRVAEQRKEIERKSKQCFVLNWFDDDNTPVKRQWVSDCPYFPFYQLADDPELVTALGENITKIEVFEDRLKEWIPASLSHPLTLESECHVFIRRYGIADCHNFDELYNTSKESMRPAHLRTNMKLNRDRLRTAINATKQSSPQLASEHVESSEVEIVDESSEVEIVDNTPVTPRPSTKALGKRPRWFSSPESSPAQSQTVQPPSSRPRLHLDLNFDFDSLRATSMSPMPPPSPSPVDSISSSDSLLLTHSTSSASSIDSGEPKAPSVIPVFIPSYKGKHVWPRSMYTIDMAAGFRQMDSLLLRQHYSQEVLFGLIFSVPFVRATYHVNRLAWANTKNTSLLLAHECAGRTLDGLWTCYLAARRDALGQTSKKKSVKSK